MKAKDLRNSILQLAVQGKLVPQDPNDEPASVLLERIRAERTQLIKEKKIKAPKNGESIIYRASDGSHYEKRGKGKPVCVDGEIPFEIPESWEWARLESITTYIQRGKSPKYSSIEQYPVVAQKCNQWSGFSLEKAKFIDPSTVLSYADERTLCDGDLLWNSTGLGTLGRMAIYDSSVNKYGWAVADSHVTVIRTDAEWFNYRFAFTYFAGPSVQSVIEDLASGSTKQKELAQDTIKNYLIPIPPLAEQRRIAERVSELIPLVEEYGKLEDEREQLDAELPDRLRKSILQIAVQGKLVPQDPSDEPAATLLERIREERTKLIKKKKIKAPKGGESVIYRGSDGGYYEKRGNGEPVCIDDEIPFEIPESWEWVRLGSLCSLLIGKTPARSEIKYWSNGSFPWVSISDMKQGEVLNKTKELVSAEAMASCFKAGLVPAGTLIMSFKLTIGRTCILGMDAVHNEAIISVQTTCDPGFTQRDYLAYQLPYLCTFGDSKDAIKGSTLNKDSLSNLLIPIPPLAEQQRIVERVDELMPPIDEQRRIADVVSNALRQFTNRQ